MSLRTHHHRVNGAENADGEEGERHADKPDDGINSANLALRAGSSTPLRSSM